MAKKTDEKKQLPFGFLLHICFNPLIFSHCPSFECLLRVSVKADVRAI